MNKTGAGSISNLCRTCMGSVIEVDAANQHIEHENQSLFEKPAGCEDGPTLMELLQLVQPQIALDVEDDNMPKIMCIDCVHQLQLCYDFLEMYKHSDNKLRKLLKTTYFTAEHEPVPLEEDSIDFIAESANAEEIEAESETAVTKIEIQQCDNNETIQISDSEENGSEECGWLGFDFEESEETEVESNELKTSNDEWMSKEETNREEATKNKRASSKKTCKQRNPAKRRGTYRRNPWPPFNDDGTVTCPDCCTTFDNLRVWREHNRLEHKQDQQNNEHEPKIKKIRKMHSCEYCGKVFQKITTYKNHLRIHTGEEPYLCIECGKSFKVVSSLNTHMLRHKGEKTVQCPHCPKKFVCASGLYGHMMVHNKDKPYVCDICGSAFHMAYMLRKHNLYHNNIKNYPCEYCDLRFVTAEKQRRHIRTHTGEKPYTCRYCDRAFAQSNDCNKHLKQHLGDNIYQCELCPLRFPLARELRVHFATHKDDDEETRAHNLEAKQAEEKNLIIKLGIKEK